MIVKIQKPLMTNDPSGNYLFYNSNRSYMAERLPTFEEVEAMKGHNKIYALYKKGKFVRRVDDKPW